MDAEKNTFPISRMAELLGVDRRRYYDWVAARGRGPTLREQAMAALVARVTTLHEASDGTYGAPRIHADLAAEGWHVSRKTVAKAMRIAGIHGISPRKYHPVTTVPFPQFLEG